MSQPSGPPAVDTAAAPMRARRVPRTAQACLWLAGLLTVFFWTPLTSGGHYAGVDLLQDFPLFQVGPPGYTPKNRLLGDTVVVMFPSLLWSRLNLRAGALPLWNPYNGWGVPHLGNYQSSVFSPYTLPYYVLPYRWALLCAPALKLFGFGLLTYLFLRRIELRHEAALVGAAAFTFAGYNVLWLHWPLSSAVIVVPAGLYLAETALRMPARSRWRRATLIAFTLALAAGLLGGHPETFFFGALLVGGWLAFRVLPAGQGWRATGARVVEFAACAVAALALAAVQLLPFLDYVRQSTTLSERKAGAVFYQLFLHLAPLHFFPHLLGSPALAHVEPAQVTGTNFIESNGSYVGLAALYLAGWAVLSWPLHRSRLVAFFALTAAVWWAYAYNVGGFARLLASVPVLGLTIPHRSHVIWVFSIASLAALAVDLALRDAAVRPSPRRALAVVAALWGATLLGAAFSSALALRRWIAALPGNRSREPVALQIVHREMAFLTATTVVAVVMFIWLVRSTDGRAARARAAAATLLAGGVFLQSGFLLRHFNPTIDSRYFYPRSPLIDEVIRRTAGEQTLFLDGAQVPPNANLWYRLRTVRNYDGMGVRHVDALTRALLGASGSPPEPLRLGSLQALGIRYVATMRPRRLKHEVRELRLEWAEGGMSLYRVPDALPRYYTVGRARKGVSEDHAIALLTAPGFDPAREVLLTEGAMGPPAGQVDVPGPVVALLEERPTRIRLRVERPGPGWLVALQTHLPGWRAVVNGREAPLLRANVAFSAVPLPAGTSEVELRYAPRSVRMGALVSGAALAGLAAAMAFTRGRAW
jgi:hypothetical protein